MAEKKQSPNYHMEEANQDEVSRRRLSAPQYYYMEQHKGLLHERLAIRLIYRIAYLAIAIIAALFGNMGARVLIGLGLLSIGLYYISNLRERHYGQLHVMYKQLLMHSLGDEREVDYYVQNTFGARRYAGLQGCHMELFIWEISVLAIIALNAMLMYAGIRI